MNSDVYRRVTDESGKDYYCPLGAIEGDGHMKRERADDCVETEVVQRYSGGIQIDGS